MGPPSHAKLTRLRRHQQGYDVAGSCGHDEYARIATGSVKALASCKCPLIRVHLLILVAPSSRLMNAPMKATNDMDEPLLKNPFSLDQFFARFGLAIEVEWVRDKRNELNELLSECSKAPGGLELICRLIKDFEMSKSEDFVASGTAIAHTVCNTWNLKAENTVIVALNRSNYSDSSEAFLWHLKPRFEEMNENWSVINFVNSMGAFASEHSKVSDRVVSAAPNVVFVDEFSGTGGTIKRQIGWAKSNTTNPFQPYLCLHASMSVAQSLFEPEFVDFYSHLTLGRGISDNPSISNTKNAIDTMVELEKILGQAPNKKPAPSLGYKKSETLYSSQQGNTPNNVFPIFWWKSRARGGKRKTLLSRLA